MAQELQIGDLIELQALTRAFRSCTETQRHITPIQINLFLRT